MKLLSLLVVAALPFVSANSTPFCTPQYFSQSICKKFDLPKGSDCNNKGGGPYFADTKNPAKFSSTRAHEFAVGITNVFENSQAQNDYATCADIGDGRGFTCGSGGYTSNDGSMKDPLDRYSELRKKNPFRKYMPLINKIAQQSSCSPFRGSTAGLKGLNKLWTRVACQDPIFRKAQDEASKANIDDWALAHAAFAGVQKDLSLAIFRDTMEQHGDGGGEPHLGIEVIIKHTKDALGGNSHDEQQFIEKFLEIRRELLCCYRPVIKGKTDLTWPQSADRIADLQSVVASGNWDLKPPIKLNNYEVTISSDFNLYATPAECKKHHKRELQPRNITSE